VEWTWLLPVASAAAVWVLARKGNRLAAAGGLAICATAGVIYLKSAALPELNRAASARVLWSEIGGRAGEVCVDGIQRDWRYGLNYYSVAPLPDCGQEPKPLAVRQASGEVPRLMPAALVAISPGNQ
jgi:hypothetical protein